MFFFALILALGIGLIVGLLGGGGSILTVPLLVYVLGISAKNAIATALLIVGITSAISALIHASRGNIRVRIGFVFSAFAMLGSYSGGRTTQFLPDWLLLTLFSTLIIMAAYLMLRPPKGHSEDFAEKTQVVSFFLPGLLVGFSTGLVGAGGGFLFVPALVLLGKFPMRAAVGTSTLITACNSFSGLAGQLSHTSIQWNLALSITGVAIVGAVVGSRLVDKVPSKSLRKSFGYFVLLMALVIMIRELTGQMI